MSVSWRDNHPLTTEWMSAYPVDPGWTPFATHYANQGRSRDPRFEDPPRLHQPWRYGKPYAVPYALGNEAHAVVRYISVPWPLF